MQQLPRRSSQLRLQGLVSDFRGYYASFQYIVVDVDLVNWYGAECRIGVARVGKGPAYDGDETDGGD